MVKYLPMKQEQILQSIGKELMDFFHQENVPDTRRSQLISYSILFGIAGLSLGGDFAKGGIANIHRAMELTFNPKTKLK